MKEMTYKCVQKLMIILRREMVIVVVAFNYSTSKVSVIAFNVAINQNQMKEPAMNWMSIRNQTITHQCRHR